MCQEGTTCWGMANCTAGVCEAIAGLHGVCKNLNDCPPGHFCKENDDEAKTYSCETTVPLSTDCTTNMTGYDSAGNVALYAGGCGFGATCLTYTNNATTPVSVTQCT